ncbi:MAG: hypothetical protein ISP86_05325 [Shewanellaceae bacterium]|nr:hypothetical protein [Shewanellaceae bacterium]
MSSRAVSKHTRTNKRKEHFLTNPKLKQGIEYSGIEKKCKFNFDYFDDTQNAGQSFRDWQDEAIKSPESATTLAKLMHKLKDYSAKSLDDWKREDHLAFYDKFPQHSEFQYPHHVPEGVQWGRFRLSGKVRLVGFRLKKDNLPKDNPSKYDMNTFYVVFLDKEHLFYPWVPANT